MWAPLVAVLAAAAPADFGPEPIEGLAFGNQHKVRLAADEQGIFAVWMSEASIVGRRVSLDGQLSPEFEVAKAGEAGGVIDLARCPATGQFVVAWAHSAPSAPSSGLVELRVLDKAGQPVRAFTEETEPVGRSRAHVACAGSSALVVWSQDGAQKLHGLQVDLAAMKSKHVVLYADSQPRGVFGPPVVGSDGAQFLVAWRMLGEARALAGLRVSASGEPAGRLQPLAQPDTDGFDAMGVASAAPGAFFVVFGDSARAWGVRLGEPQPLTLDSAGRYTEVATTVTSDGYLVAWANGTDLHAAGVPATGPGEPLKMPAADARIADVALAYAGGHAWVAYSDGRPLPTERPTTTAGLDVRLRRLPDGPPLLLSRGLGAQRGLVIAGGDRQFLAAWLDDATNTVRASRVSSAGELLDRPGLVLGGGAMTELHSLEATPDGGFTLHWWNGKPVRTGVSADGKVLGYGDDPYDRSLRVVNGFEARPFRDACSGRECLALWNAPNDCCRLWGARIIDGKPETTFEHGRLYLEGPTVTGGRALFGLGRYLIAALYSEGSRKIGLSWADAQGEPTGEPFAELGNNVENAVQVAFDGQRFAVGWSEESEKADPFRWTTVAGSKAATEQRLGVAGYGFSLAATQDGALLGAWTDGVPYGHFMSRARMRLLSPSRAAAAQLRVEAPAPVSVSSVLAAARASAAKNDARIDEGLASLARLAVRHVFETTRRGRMPLELGAMKASDDHRVVGEYQRKFPNGGAITTGGSAEQPLLHDDYRVTKDAKFSYVFSSVIVCDGSLKIAAARDSLIIATGTVDVGRLDSSVVIAREAKIGEVGSELSWGRGFASIVLTTGALDATTAHGAVLAAPEVKLGRSNFAVTLNAKDATYSDPGLTF